MRQVLVFVKFGPKGDRFVPPSIPVKIAGKPDDVWTLWQETDENNPPQLPIRPGRSNAFHEDYVHDWNVDREGNFRYFSRITSEPVWVLLEYK